jgi:chromosome segregation ATPase
VVIPEEDEARRKRTPQEEEFDTFAERRARRAWLGDAALLRRAEAAEASVSTLEAHLADLRARQVESEHAREHIATQLAERELELRRVKQREYAEQQLRVEAEEIAVRARRGHRTERDRWQRRVEEAHAAAQYAEEQRDALAARLATVNESCERLRQGVVTLQGVAAELRATFELEHRTSQARIRELEGELERARAHPLAEQRSEAEEAQRREEMAGALAAAVARLRTRAAVATEQPQAGEGLAPQAPVVSAPEQPPAEAPAAPATAGSPRTEPGSPEVSTVIVVPRLFATHGRPGRRLAPAVRRVAVRLARWADRAQGRPR